MVGLVDVEIGGGSNKAYCLTCIPQRIHLGMARRNLCFLGVCRRSRWQMMTTLKLASLRMMWTSRLTLPCFSLSPFFVVCALRCAEQPPCRWRRLLLLRRLSQWRRSIHPVHIPDTHISPTSHSQRSLFCYWVWKEREGGGAHPPSPPCLPEPTLSDYIWKFSQPFQASVVEIYHVFG